MLSRRCRQRLRRRNVAARLYTMCTVDSLPQCKILLLVVIPDLYSTCIVYFSDVADIVSEAPMPLGLQDCATQQTTYVAAVGVGSQTNDLAYSADIDLHSTLDYLEVMPTTRRRIDAEHGCQRGSRQGVVLQLSTFEVINSTVPQAESSCSAINSFPAMIPTTTDEPGP